jgi:curli biogenesis system outer membrane secretion channel CsgG
MVRISAIVATSLALSATAAMAQVKATPLPGDATATQAQRQQMAASERDKSAIDSFIFDEYGNVYDSRGDIIKPRPTRR